MFVAISVVLRPNEGQTKNDSIFLALPWYYKTAVFRVLHIDSLDGLTFQNQLISILLVMPTGQHLHALFSFLACP